MILDKKFHGKEPISHTWTVDTSSCSDVVFVAPHPQGSSTKAKESWSYSKSRRWTKRTRQPWKPFRTWAKWWTLSTTKPRSWHRWAKPPSGGRRNCSSSSSVPALRSTLIQWFLFFFFLFSDSERLVGSAMEELCVIDRRSVTSEEGDKTRSSAKSHKLQPDRIPPSNSPSYPPPMDNDITSLVCFCFVCFFLFDFFFFLNIFSGLCITLSGHCRPSGNIVQPQ